MLYYLTLLLPGFTCLFWTVTMALRTKTNQQPQNIWIAACALMTVSTFIWAIFFGGVSNYALFYKLEALESITSLMLPMILYFCFRSMTNERPFGWKMYACLAPALAVGLTIVLLYAMMGEERAMAYVKTTIESGGHPTGLSGVEQVMAIVSGPVYTILMVVQMVAVLIYATIQLARYRRRLKDFYSNLEGKSVENNRALLIGGYLILLFSLLSYRGRFHYNEPSFFLSLHMICWAVLIYYMAYNIYKLRFTAHNLATELEQADREATELHFDSPDPVQAGKATGRSTGEIDKHTRFLQAFVLLMDEKHLYLQADLRLDEVARLMLTNRTYISRMIHEVFHCSFSDYINRRRIEHAQSLMYSDHHLTQVQIAEQSGFSSAPAFSRMFKQRTGVTFLEWRKHNIL